jgi:23S rRNA (guanosine2251-2'-O)-methyltransferase
MTRNKHGKHWKPRLGPSGGQPLAAPGGGFSAKPSAKGAFWLYGRHPVLAALVNPRRHVLRLVASDNAREELDKALKNCSPELKRPEAEPLSPQDLDRLLPAGSLHQGMAAEVLPLADLDLHEICELRPENPHNLVLVLDQVTDPHNVGAIIRSGAAFGARAVVTTDRHAPPESGALAKSASGALEIMPWVRVINLARALDDLAELGFWRIGLDGSAEKAIDRIDPGQNVVLVLGAEGAGLRRGTIDHCDYTARLPISPAVESLNVSNAAAVALYALTRNPNEDG